MDADHSSHGEVRDPPHVLVVDDDHEVREIAATALELVGGWTVSTADSGRTAVELARLHRPDAILLDVMMPDLDGPATVKYLRGDSATAEIPVVLLTAKTRLSDKARWAEMGLAGMIGKPFDPMTLADHLAEMLGWTR